MDTPITHCLNCATDLHGMVFCGNCGQRNVHRRLDWRALVDDVNSQILEWNLPWLKTIKDLTLRPGLVCSAYADGNRIVYVNPVKYMFYIVAVLLILFSGIGTIDIQALMDPFMLDLYPAALRYLVTNIPFYMLLMSPVAILIYRLLFWRSPRTWVEISCFVFYMIGHSVFLYSAVSLVVQVFDPFLSPLLPFGDNSGDLAGVFGVFGIPVYIAWTSASFFKSRLDWSLVGALAGYYLYFYACFVIPYFMYKIYEPVIWVYYQYQ